MKTIPLMPVSIIALSLVSGSVFAKTVYLPAEYQPKIQYEAPAFNPTPTVKPVQDSPMAKATTDTGIETSQALAPIAVGINKPGMADGFSHSEQAVIPESARIIQPAHSYDDAIETSQALAPIAVGNNKPSMDDGGSHSEQAVIPESARIIQPAHSLGVTLLYLGLVTVLGLVLLFLRKKQLQNRVAGSQSVAITTQTITATGVERYLQALNSKQTGVEKYVQNRSSAPALTGVAKYIAKQVVKDRAG